MDNESVSEDPVAQPPIRERIAQLKRRRKELAQQEEERNLLREIEERQQRLADEPPTSPSPLPSQVDSLPPFDLNSQIDNDEPPPARRQRLASGEAAPVRGPKIEKIPMFEGKGIREYRDFETRLLIAFRLDPMAFLTEDQRIAFTLQYLIPTYRQLWLQREQEDDSVTLGWREMMDFLLDLMKSPINRELQMTLQYSRAAQREGQSVNEFAAYLATIENQIDPPYDPKHLMMHLYTKLRTEIRVALSNYADFPKTRRELVERASTLEDNLQRSRAEQPRRRRDANASQRPIARHSSNNQPPRSTTRPPANPSQRTGGSPDKTCFYCKKPGHWAQYCRFKYSNQRQEGAPTSGVNNIRVPKNS